MTSRRIRW